VVAFQPHRYSRVATLYDDFTRAFYEANSLLVLPIYSAGEAPIPEIDGQSLCEEIREHGHKDASFHDGLDAAVSHLKKTLRKGDVLLTLGAGDVWQVGERLLKELE
jgi:UDP-N-acetylmuramate--alanine ligase